MAGLQRRFQFFDKFPVVEPGTKKPLEVVQKMKIQCVASGRGKMLLGDKEGYVNILDRDFALDGFRGHTKSIVSLVQINARNLLVTAGVDEESPVPTVKVWNMDKEDKGGSRLMRSVKIQGASERNGVTCLACLDDLGQLAVGLADGTVLVIAGADLMRENNPKQRMVVEKANGAVTGMGFLLQGNAVVLFVATLNRVVRVVTSGKDLSAQVLDEFGCQPNCCTMTDTGEFAMGRDEAVYFYTPEGRGACRPFEGTKYVVAWFRSYLLIVSEDQNNKEMHAVNIYNLHNQFNAFSLAFTPVAHVANEWGSVFLLCENGRMYRLEERDTQTKLETLFRRGLYNVALSVAQSQNYDESALTDIHRKFGDHLYLKSDFDSAIESYVRTIGYLEPSYVIRKFLDAQRIHNLTTYLQALHQKGVANADHTTLLLNCYTKLKDIDKLNEFIHSNAELHFEVETAIKVCRQAGYHEHALDLAKRHNEHTWYLKILLEDTKGFGEAMKYIRTLDFYEAELCLKQYGKSLLAELPKETTQLLKDLCTSYQPTPQPAAAAAAASSSASVPPAKGKKATAAAPVKDDLSDVEFDFSDQSRKVNAKAVPDEYLHIFIEQPALLVEFLESVIAQEDCSSVIYTTLLEAYLREADEDTRRTKCLGLLSNQRAKFDNDQALVLCQMYGFGNGVQLLYQKMELYQEIVSHYMEQREYKGVLDACTRFGERDPMLWVQALSYFANEPGECEAEITQVLKQVEALNLLTPIRVIQMLAVKDNSTLAVVKDFIVRNLQEQTQQMEEDQAEIRKCKEETRQMRQEIDELTHNAKVFQQNRCTLCKQLLSLPSVHFLCMHSFHQGCLLEDDEVECPVCGPKTAHIRELKKQLEEARGDHDTFFKKLSSAKDGFAVVAEYYGRGMFSAPPPPPAAKDARKAAPPRK